MFFLQGEFLGTSAVILQVLYSKVPRSIIISYAINHQLKESAWVGLDQKHNGIGSGTEWKGIVIFLQGLMVDDVYQFISIACFFCCSMGNSLVKKLMDHSIPDF